MNFLPARVGRSGGGLLVQLEGAGQLPIADPPPGLAERAGGQVVVGIRAENIEVLPNGGQDGALRARCLVVEPLGSHNLLTLRLGEELVKATARPTDPIAPDVELGLRLDVSRIRWLDAETDRAFGDAEGGPGRPPVS